MLMQRHKVMLWTILIITLIVAGWYWYEGSWDRKLFRKETGKICVNIRPAEAKALIASNPEVQVLDVRSDSEFAAGALPGAVHISIGDPQFDEKVVRLDVTKPVLVYCAGGFRSRKAVERLKELGFAHIEHLHRGYHSWTLSGGGTQG